MNKKTEQLLNEMKKSRDYEAFLSENDHELIPDVMKINLALSSLLAEKNIPKATAIARSGLEPHYGYQILSGTKIPSRDKVIMLCVGISLSVDEIQRLLTVTGYAPLYGRNARDNIILFGIMQQMTIIEINEILFDKGHDLLL